MTQIERRQVRIHRIRKRHEEAGKSPNEEVPCTPDVHHGIAKSQNFPESIPNFLHKHAGDPAIKVFVLICALGETCSIDLRTSFLVSKITCFRVSKQYWNRKQCLRHAVVLNHQISD